MQTTTDQFRSLATSEMRPLSWSLRISFDRSFSDTVTFFTLDTSILDGPDLLAPNDSDVIQEWDKYEYTDYSNRVISMEWQNQQDVPFSVNLAMADIVLDNHDDYFTPGASSTTDTVDDEDDEPILDEGGSEITSEASAGIGEFILPNRPVKIAAGFGGENIQVFVGLTEKMPVVDYKNKTVSFHCVDFLSAIFNRPLDESSIYVNKKTDYILTQLFTDAGLTSAQMDIAPGFNLVPFAYFEKGRLLGDVVRELMEAELGSLYMSELGVITFRSRNLIEAPDVYFFDKSNTVDAITSGQDDIINVVQVNAPVRQVQELQPVYLLSSPVYLEALSTVTIWADFSDPVVSVNDPSNGFNSNNSYFIATVSEEQDSATVDSDIAVDSSDLFANSYKLVLENNNAFAVYISTMELWGQPAKVTTNISLRDQDDDSVAKYDERVLTVDNEYLQSASQAQTLAAVVLDYYAEFGSTVEMNVKGSPALQLADNVLLSLGPTTGSHEITKSVNKLFIRGSGASYEQRLTVKRITRRSFFVLNVSLLDGTDVLG